MANEPGFILNEVNGGINWGYCQENSENSKAEVKYIAEVETSTLPGSGTSSTVKVILYSDTGTSPPITLSQSGFQEGVLKKVKFSAQPFGKIKKIKLFAEGIVPYRAKSIRIISNSGVFDFEITEKLKPCGITCGVEVDSNGSTPYEITIKTSEIGTNAIIMISLIGTNGFTNFRIFSENGMKQGSFVIKTFKMNDIGNVIGYKLRLDSDGKWSPSYMIVQNKLTKNAKTFILTAVTLVSPGLHNMYSYTETQADKTPSTGISSNNSLNPQEDDLKDPNDPTTLLDNDPNITYDVNTSDGGLLNPEDQKNIIDLSCDQTLVNPDAHTFLFGPDLPTLNANYVNILARCPHNCYQSNAYILSQGIHPMNSPICLSALYDRAISIYGGIISISVFPGLSSYPFNSKLADVGNIHAKSFYFPSKKSFVITKVDNVDIVESDMRILDDRGKLSYSGRLEIRRNGVWGTICNKGNNVQSAITICRELGYKFGEWENLSTKKTVTSCKNFKSNNYCGADFQRIHYTSIICREQDSSFQKCSKIIPDYNTCSHSDDAIISCSNKNFEGESGSSGTDYSRTVRFGAGKWNNSNLYLGRVEVMTTEFLPICNKGVNYSSIQVLCKSMGFKHGEIVDDRNVQIEFQYDTTSNIGFSATKINCTGDENFFKECTFQNDKACKHDQDLIITCFGSKGDPSGKNQLKKNIIPDPQLGKLSLPNFDITCDTLGTFPKFRGDPGSLYLIKCPKLCASSDGMVIGTGIYANYSYVCKSAIHAGLISNDSGGMVALVKTFGHTDYRASYRNEIQSSSSEHSVSYSFYFTSLNSAWIRMNQMYKNSNLPPQLNEMFTNSHISDNTSFIELSTDTDTNTPMNMVMNPVFKFFPTSIDFRFTPKDNFIINQSIGMLNTFTLITSFKMSYFNNTKQFIFSHSGCSGFNVYIDHEDFLVIGDPCNKASTFKSNLSVPIDDKVFLYVYYMKGKLQIILKTEKSKINLHKSFNINLLFRNKSKIGIGRLGQVNKYTFNGFIDYIFVFDSQVPLNILSETINKLIKENQIIKSPPKLNQTLDGRTCISPCISSNPPPSEKAGVPPKEALPDYGIILHEPPGEAEIKNTNSENILNNKGTNINNQGDAGQHADPGNHNNDKPGNNPHSSQSLFTTKDSSQTGNIETLPIQCETTLKDARFNIAPGTTIRVNCPNCSTFNKKLPVFGTQIFHPLSSICKASYHSGVIKPNTKSDILVHMLTGKRIYNGSTGLDGSISGTFGSSDSSFSVQKAPSIELVSCFQTADSGRFASSPVLSRIVIKCPANCSKIGEVYGNEVYGESSAICRAAIHFGSLSDKGGEVDFIIEGGSSFYKGVSAFGILSKSHEGFVRSFRFLGGKTSIFHRYLEKFNGVLTNNWEIMSSNKSKENIWTYKKISDYTTGKFHKIEAIYHSSVSGSGGNAGHNKILNYSSLDGVTSIIKLKNADWSNGKISFNFVSQSSSPIVILFRYIDKDNCYGIIFDFSTEIKNIKLFSIVESNFRILDSKSHPLLLNKTYLGKILVDFEYVKFNLRIYGVNDTQYLFSKELNSGSLSRGSLAIGSFGNNSFYVSGVEIVPYTVNTKKEFINNDRSWNEILTHNSIYQKKKWCNKIFFGSQENERLRCLEDHIFCMYRCDDWINPVENILNYKCYRQCHQRIIMNKKLPSLSSGNKWTPQVGNKVDFIVNGDTIPQPGNILEVKSQNMLIIGYINIDGEFTKTSIKINQNVFKCGEKLSMRTDCAL